MRKRGGERRRIKVLGVSASLRNGRFGKGSDELVEEIAALPDREALNAYLKMQGNVRAQEFIAAGRAEGRPFDAIYANLSKMPRVQGLSNSEVALAAGLWGAIQERVEIDHVGLAQHFPASGPHRDLDLLVRKLKLADAIILSGPVYFGDRGSLAQDFIEFIRNTPELKRHFEGKAYGGIAVGAKRNGGQETTLIYQMVDMSNTGLLCVGNDSETTAQYGGTVVAGDVGTAPADDYGTETSIGTGRRVARVARMIHAGKTARLADRLRVGIWLLQDDKAGTGKRHMMDLLASAGAGAVDYHLLDFTDLASKEIVRCIACDVCPVEMGRDEKYRCIIVKSNDLLKMTHESLVNVDALIVAAYSAIDRAGAISTYQRVIERTRYLRHSDYILSDILVAPLVFSELGSNQNLHIRMMTSMLRHHTIMNHPIIGWLHEGGRLRWEETVRDFRTFLSRARRIRAGWLSTAVQASDKDVYNPVGFVIGSAITGLAAFKEKQSEGLKARQTRRVEAATRRLVRAISPAR